MPLSSLATTGKLVQRDPQQRCNHHQSGMAAVFELSIGRLGVGPLQQLVSDQLPIAIENRLRPQKGGRFDDRRPNGRICKIG